MSTRSRRGLLAWAVLVAILVFAPVFLDRIQLGRLSRDVALASGVLGVNVATGYGGLITLGHGAFMGIGAFSTAYFLDKFNWPFAVAIPGGALFALVCGCVFALPALRIRGIYLALVTFGFAIVFPMLARRFTFLTGGVTGKPIKAALEPPAWTGLDQSQRHIFVYLVVVGSVAAAFILVAGVVNSRPGRALRAVRDGEIAAASSGVNLVTTKVGAFGLSAGLAGLTGALHVSSFPFVSHEQFSFVESLRLYAAAVVGGLGSLLGSMLGAAMLIAAPRVNDALELFSSDVFFLGAALLVLTLFFPRGLVGMVDRLRELSEWWSRSPLAKETEVAGDEIEILDGSVTDDD